jgi:hypothetical protein
MPSRSSHTAPPWARSKPYGPRKLDPIKAMVAQSIQHHLVTGANRPALPEKPEEVVDVTGFVINPSEIRLRVKLENDTYRTFTVNIRENK